MNRTLVYGGITLGLLLLVIQFIPVSGARTNPPVIAEPVWDSNQTYALVKRACFDCHSNATVWPWYSRVAPVSWLMVRDVQLGRQELNFSEWHRRQEGADEVVEVIIEGSMPPRLYLLAHPEARLSVPERQALAAGLRRTLGSEAYERD